MSQLQMPFYLQVVALYLEDGVHCRQGICRRRTHLPDARQKHLQTHCSKFKRIGDRLQADCFADGGDTFDFYFRNKPVDNHWVKMGLAPLHCRLMHMFSRLEDDGHEVNMDNLYNSVKFARAAYSLEVA